MTFGVAALKCNYMAEAIQPPIGEVSFERQEQTGETSVRGQGYELRWQDASPRAVLSYEDNKVMELSLGSQHTAEMPDEMADFGQVECEAVDGGVVIRRNIASSAWQKKTIVYTCHEKGFEVAYELTVPEGESRRLDSCDYFGGNYATTGESGYFPSRMKLTEVFNPSPTCAEQETHPVSQPSTIGVTGYARPGRDHWFATPAPYCYGFGNGETWVMAGIRAPLSEQHFTSYQYDGFDRAFSLRLEYERQLSVSGTFRTPELAIRFAEDYQEGLAAFCDEVRRETDPAYDPAAIEPRPDWWRRPIFCGWGAQVEQAAMEAVTPQALSRQDRYDGYLAALQERGIRPGTLTIDDKWQGAYGTNHADPDKWPDLPGWIERRHAVGQKVLLWIKLWDNEGLPPDWCVRAWDGKPVTADPSHPDYLDAVRRQVRHMLGGDGYDADGFKIDFIGRTPSGKTLQFHGAERGSALLHTYLKTMYDEAKRIKPDSLVVTHTPNPYFHDVTDMLRLNDVNSWTSVRTQMIRRAEVARAALPDKLIDTDDWPMPSIYVWKKYVELQPKLGVPALYYAGRIAGHDMTPADWELLRRTWESYESGLYTG